MANVLDPIVHGEGWPLQGHEVPELCLHQSIQLKCVICMILYVHWILNLLIQWIKCVFYF